MRLVQIIGLLFLSAVCNAQQISVTVLDKNNGNTVPFAYIHIMSTNTNSPQNTVQTNENGYVEFSPMEYPCTIEVTMLGFETVKKTFFTRPVTSSMTIYLTKKFSSMNEVVVTGMAQPTKLKDATSIYQVITKEQIQAQGAVTLDEVMKNRLNVRVSTDNILGSSMRMQGMSGDKVKILIDGLPINGREGGNINLGQINLNNVDRIEIIQGPMSVVYGSDALGGVVNIITKKQKRPWAINAGTYYETVGKYNFDLSATKRFKDRHQLTIGGGRNLFDGWKNIDEIKTYGNDTLYTNRVFLFKPNTQYLGNFAYNYTAKSGFNLTLASDFLKEKVTNRGGLLEWSPFEATAKDEYYRTTRSMNRLSLGGKLGKKGSWLSQNGFMYYHRTRNRYNVDMTTLNKELSKEQGVNDTSSFRDIYARGSYINSIGRFNYTIGYDINLQYATSLKISGKDKTIQDYAAYANLSYQVIKDKLKVQTGFRGSYNTTYNPPIIPTVNILFTPINKLQIRASYAKGYRAPSLKEMYLSFIDVNHYVIGNEKLRAENSQHVQLSASYQAYEDNNNYLQFIVSGYYNDVFDGITLAPIHPEDSTSIEYTYANMDHQQNAIANIQADGQVSNLHFQLGYSFNRTFANPGNYAAFSASEATATLQYTWRKPAIGFNLFYKYTGKQPFLQASIDGSAYYNGTQNGYNIADASVERKFLNKKLQVILGVKNIFNFQQPAVSGRSSSGTHGGGISSNLPRSLFTSVRFTLD